MKDKITWNWVCRISQHWMYVADSCSRIHLFNLQVEHLRISCYCFVRSASSAWAVNPAVFILAHAPLPINWFWKWNLAGISWLFGDGIQLAFPQQSWFFRAIAVHSKETFLLFVLLWGLWEDSWADWLESVFSRSQTANMQTHDTTQQWRL